MTEKQLLELYDFLLEKADFISINDSFQTRNSGFAAIKADGEYIFFVDKIFRYNYNYFIITCQYNNQYILSRHLEIKPTKIIRVQTAR